MATADAARVQLSKDVGDYFASTTTSQGAAAGATIVDTRLSEEDDDRFVNTTRRTTIVLTSGDNDGEERAIASKSSATATMARNFGAQIATSVTYEVHRLFSGEEKDDAITVAIDSLTGPILFKKHTSTVTTVADQFDYDISAAAYHLGRPHQVHQVSDSDSEITEPLYDWEVRVADMLHLNTRIAASKTLRLFGHKVLALSDLSGGTLLIITAHAAIYLLQQAVTAAPHDAVGRYEGMLRLARERLVERVRLFKPIGYTATQFAPGLRRKTSGDISWRAT